MILKLPAFFVFLCLLITGKAWAQTSVVTATITDSEISAPVAGLDVTVLSGTNIIYHTVCDTTGSFAIPQNIYQQMSSVRVSGLNYIDLIIKKADQQAKEPVTSLGTFKIKSRAIELKEVKVRSSKRYSDTTQIDLSKKKFERSVMVDDLFSKDYGFTKDNNGRLYYKGDLVSDLEVDGGDFFGKNNLDIFHLLPALVLKNIEVVKTNIDSTTNTTTLRPSVKIDLKLKDQYKKGLFGNANACMGTAERYLVNTNLFGYNKTRQVSLVLNSNNIDAGDNLILTPTVNFSANSNNVTTNNAKLTYSDNISKKVQLSFSAKGKIDDKNFSSESDRNDFDIHQLSTSTTSSAYKTYSLTDANLDIFYKIDPLNSITITEKANYNHTRNNDSINYQITADSLNSLSRQARVRNSATNNLMSQLLYKRKFASKKGRLLSIRAQYDDNTYRITENDNVNSLYNTVTNSYFVDDNQSVDDKQLSINADYLEPLSDNSHISFFLNYKNDQLDYDYQVKSDTTVNIGNVLNPAIILNQYIRMGVKYHHTFDKVSFDGNVTGVVNLKDIQGEAGNDNSYRVNLDMSSDINIDKQHELVLNLQTTTNYPGVDQLTNLNSTFDLVSQLSGNVNLKPEDNQTIKASYNIKNADMLSFSAEVDHFTSKFGYSINSIAGTIPSTMVTNVGNATTASLSFSLNKIFSDKHYINYNSSINYQEQPSIVNNVLTPNNGVSFYQSVSTTIPLSSYLSFNPQVSASFSRYFYGPQSTNIVALSYAGSVTADVAKFQVTAYPLLNYNHTISNNSSFSMNGEVKRSFFKNYLTMWLQAYDIFNSFKFYNTLIGPTYTQTTRFSNLQRYVFLGLSYKFNNLK